MEFSDDEIMDIYQGGRLKNPLKSPKANWKQNQYTSGKRAYRSSFSHLLCCIDNRKDSGNENEK